MVKFVLTALAPLCDSLQKLNGLVLSDPLSGVVACVCQPPETAVEVAAGRGEGVVGRAGRDQTGEEADGEATPAACRARRHVLQVEARPLEFLSHSSMRKRAVYE